MNGEPDRDLFRALLHGPRDDLDMLLDCARAVSADWHPPMDDAAIRRAAVAAFHHPGAIA
jgi:hypothetical protein